MKTRITRLWRRLRESFWFVPSLIVAACMVAALALTELDTGSIEPWLARWPRVFGASAEAARGILSTIAGSMMTVVGISFSMTLVTLTLASSQYTSRILRTFMADQFTQVVLGIFTGIFTYCLIVQRTIRGGENEFVPSVAVMAGVLMAIGGIGVLILFIHHIATSIQASSIIAAVSRETLNAVDRLFPAEIGHEAAEEDPEKLAASLAAQEWQIITAPTNGYLQGADTDELLRLAGHHDTVVRMEVGIGSFVVQDTPLVSVALRTKPSEELDAGLQAAFGIGRHRTLEQDVGFGIRQLVDMALRALSPGVNDTTTAVMCVDFLTAILAKLVRRDVPAEVRLVEGQPRLIAIRPTFAGLVENAFDQIRSSATGNVAIMLRLLGAVKTLAQLTRNQARLKPLQRQMEGIEEVIQTLSHTQDRQRAEGKMDAVRALLEERMNPSCGMGTSHAHHS